jgi:hypothetical protein
MLAGWTHRRAGTVIVHVVAASPFQATQQMNKAVDLELLGQELIREVFADGDAGSVWTWRIEVSGHEIESPGERPRAG